MSLRPQSESFPAIQKCILCATELDSHNLETGYPEDGLYLWEDDSIPVCLNCRKCYSCAGITTAAETQLCLENEFPIQHARCAMLFSKGIGKQANSNGDITLHSSLYEFLNLCRLTIFPSAGCSEETNIKLSETAHTQLIERMTTEEKYLHLKMIEFIYGTTFVLLRKDKDTIKKELLLRDNENYKDAHAKVKEQETKKKEKKEVSEETKEAKKGLSAMEKTLDGLMKAGLPRELAITQAKAMWESKRGPGTWTIEV